MVYGAAWCENTTHVRRLLTDWGIDYHYIDIDNDGHALRKVARWSFGKLVTPAVSIGVLENPRLLGPKDAELHAMLFDRVKTRTSPFIL